ncbi:MAG: YbjN domain-containing protein [Cytophagaceae bacterium]|nr:YbjN domain-containing protein [Cytophagaceae bacterium]MDW8457229.1 YbjN domain-containing protein [Cytophagaceae bacterium]
MRHVTREEVEALIDRYVSEIGLTKEQTYNPERRAWYWVRGSARIEVFVQEIPMGGYSRFFLRVFSPIMRVPAGRELECYRKLLELNDVKLGLKLTLMKGTDQVYATYERDINGIDYEELSTTIADLEWWADKLDDELQLEFAGDYISERR